MKIELWHELHEEVIEIRTIPLVGSHIHLDQENPFTLASNEIRNKGEVKCSYEVVRINYWLNNEGYEDEVSVVVKNILFKETARTIKEEKPSRYNSNEPKQKF